MLRVRANWSRPLPQPLLIPDVMTLRTLADVRRLLEHVPQEHRHRAAWSHLASVLAGAAHGALEPNEVTVAIRLAFALERGECQPA